MNDSSPKPEAVQTRATWLLLCGAAIGLGLASFGLIESSGLPGGLPQGAAAIVGDRTIRRVDYERVLAGVEGDLRSPIDDAMRRRVLDRMVDEELLVQRALDLGLAVIDRRVRGELTSGLIDSIVSEVDAEEPSTRDIERHFNENVDFFTRPGRIHMRTLFFSKRREDATERAREAAERLRAGAAPDEVEGLLADSQVSPVPDVLLPASKVRDYVGPTILKSLDDLAVGDWSEPIENGGGLYLAQLVDREDALVPPFEEVRDLVRQDLKRRRGDEALRRYLDDLRAEIPVEVDESIFTPTTGGAPAS